VKQICVHLASHDLVMDEKKKSCQYFNTCYSSEHRVGGSCTDVYEILTDLEPYNECSSYNIYAAVLLQLTAQKHRKHCETKH
jgi:hypothetical protein